MPCTFERNVYFASVARHVVYMSVSLFALKYSWSPTFFEFLSGWPTHYWRWVINVLNIALLSISPFRPMGICLTYLGGDLGWLYIHDYYIFLMNWPYYHYVMILFSLITVFISKSLLSDRTSYPCSLWSSNCMEYFLYILSLWTYVCTLKLK